MTNENIKEVIKFAQGNDIINIQIQADGIVDMMTESNMKRVVEVVKEVHILSNATTHIQEVIAELLKESFHKGIRFPRQHNLNKVSMIAFKIDEVKDKGRTANRLYQEFLKYASLIELSLATLESSELITL